MNRFNRLVSIVLSAAFFLNLPLYVEAAQFKLEEGTVIRLKLTQTLSSKDNHEGERVNFEVVDNVYAPDKTTLLIKAGTPAYGTITRVEENGSVGKQGELGLSIDRTEAVDGTKVPLRAMMSKEGQAKRGSAIGLGVVTGLIFLPGLLFLMKKGKDAKIPAGSELDAYTNMDVVISSSPAPAMPVAGVEPEAGAGLNLQSQTPEYLQKYTDGKEQASAATVMTTSVSPKNESYLKELETLGRLRKQGVITEAEFQAKKKQLLGL